MFGAVYALATERKKKQTKGDTDYQKIEPD